MMNKEKTCTKCGVIKPLSEFSVCRNSHRSECRPCRVAYAMDWARRNPDRYAISHKRWHLENRQKKAEQQREYRKKNAEKCKENDRIKRRNNPELYREIARRSTRKHAARKRARNTEWREKNAARFKAMQKNWYENNRGRALAICRARQTRKINAMPGWVNRFFVSEIYHLASLRSKYTGIHWEVDHIVPLMSKLVCGLHCEQNLRIIPRAENMRKSNRVWTDMP